MQYAYAPTMIEAIEMVQNLRTNGQQAYMIECFGQFEVRYWSL